MKRFTDTEKWRDPWYLSIPPKIKLLWLYFCDTCDHAGVFQVDWGLASYSVGFKVNVKDLSYFEDRIQPLPSGRYLIKKYVPFQSGTLTETCPAHKPILKLVSQHGLVQTEIGYQYPMARVLQSIEYCYPTGYPMPYPSVSVQEEEKEKRKEEGSVRGELSVPEKFTLNGEFLMAWDAWMQVRISIKKSSNFNRLFQSQLNWLNKFTVPEAIEMLEQSTRNEWQGLFRLKTTGGIQNGNGSTNHKQTRGPSRTEGTYNANPKSLEHLVQTGTPRLPNLERPSAGVHA